MSKINNDHGSGYAFGSDFSLSAFNAEQKQLKKKRGRDDDTRTCRQTFAVPFNTKCANCDHILVKGLHGYMNRYRARDATTKKPLEYLRIPIWDVAFKCPRCGHNIIYRTDFETSHITAGYHIITNGKRMAGDFHELMSKAAEAEEARKIEEAKTASIPEAERKGLENQRRKEEAARLDTFMEGRKATTTPSGVSSLHDQLLLEASGTMAGGSDNNGSSDLVGGSNGLVVNDSVGENNMVVGETSNNSSEDVIARLRLELGIVVGEDGTIMGTDEDGEMLDDDYEAEGKDVSVSPPQKGLPPPNAVSQEDDLVDFFLGAAAASNKVSQSQSSVPPPTKPAEAAVVVAPPVVLSNDDFFAQF